MTLREWGLLAVAIVAVPMLIVTQIDLLRVRRQLQKEKKAKGFVPKNKKEDRTYESDCGKSSSDDLKVKVHDALLAFIYKVTFISDYFERMFNSSFVRGFLFI